MATRLVIAHLNGSKTNQIEQFPLDTSDELLIGRDPGAAIAFDMQRDDAVSRRHAMIRIERGEAPAVKLVDLGSSNGTLVNGQRVAGETELQPGDVVELGRNGPKFRFDLAPRPPMRADRTRLVPLDNAMTRVEPFAAPKPPAPGLLAPPNPRPASTTLILGGVAALLFIVLGLGGALYFGAGAVLGKAAAGDMTPLDIAAKFGNATTYIAMQWQLRDKETGKRIFHKLITWKRSGNLVPAYVKLPNGLILRWLTTEDENHLNEPIGEEGSGSGFVVDGQGYILTNKHVAAGWMVEYGFQPYELGGGALFTVDSSFKIVNVAEFDPTDSAALQHWIPDSGGIVFDTRAPTPLSASAHLFEGYNEQLEARFPGQRVSYAGRLIRASADADVAEIRIDSIQGLPTVELEKNDGIRVGEKVTVMGYPGISEQTFATIVSNEVGRPREHQELIPEPTVTDGLIAKLGHAAQRQQDGVTTNSSLGDVYQLTVLATGAGNSGGPVFNAAGRVIGLFTYSRTRGTERVTFAVPIRYGRDLVAPQRVN
jgi:S1-C subfamily serine protease